MLTFRIGVHVRNSDIAITEGTKVGNNWETQRVSVVAVNGGEPAWPVRAVYGEDVHLSNVN